MKLLTPTEVIESIKDGKQVEYTYGNEKEWCEFKPFDFTIENLLDEYYSFRLAQEMITIGDVSFPKPETEPLAQGITYYTPDIDDIYMLHIDWHGLMTMMTKNSYNMVSFI